jgi:hypothetical protein
MEAYDFEATPTTSITWLPPYRCALMAPMLTARLGWRIRRPFQGMFLRIKS